MIETNVLVDAASVRSAGADSGMVTVLVAAAGFAGWFIQDWYKQSVTSNNITCALLAEIQAIDHVIDQHLNKWWLPKVIRDQEAASYASPLPPLVPFSIDVYDSLADKIGLLDPELAAAIIDYYRMLHFINRFQGTVEQHQPALRKDFCGTYTTLLQKQLKKVRDENIETAQIINKYFAKFNMKLLQDAGNGGSLPHR